MNHQGALQEMSVEKYLLGELSGGARELFEEHLFECPACAADLKAGLQMFEGLRSAAVPIPAQKPLRQTQSWLRFFSPVWVAPALAACLLTIAYQAAVVVPRMRTDLARANMPAVLPGLSLTGVTRGSDEPKVSAPRGGSFLLNLDIPPVGDYSSYNCLLYSEDGTLLWRVAISPEQARETVQIRVPVSAATPGQNVLKVQGIPAGNSAGTQISALNFVLDVQ